MHKNAQNAHNISNYIKYSLCNKPTSRHHFFNCTYENMNLYKNLQSTYDYVSTMNWNYINNEKGASKHPISFHSFWHSPNSWIIISNISEASRTANKTLPRVTRENGQLPDKINAASPHAYSMKVGEKKKKPRARKQGGNAFQRCAGRARKSIQGDPNNPSDWEI